MIYLLYYSSYALGKPSKRGKLWQKKLSET
jgi:hypothetical protein